jgi:hypothetical protein
MAGAAAAEAGGAATLSTSVRLANEVAIADVRQHVPLDSYFRTAEHLLGQARDVAARLRCLRAKRESAALFAWARLLLTRALWPGAGQGVPRGEQRAGAVPKAGHLHLVRSACSVTRPLSCTLTRSRVPRRSLILKTLPAHAAFNDARFAAERKHYKKARRGAVAQTRSTR